MIKRGFLFVVVFLCFSGETRGQVVRADRGSFGARIRGYVSTHKELLASDLLVFGAEAADAYSSTWCQREGAHFSPNPCHETNPFLGPHPGPTASWSFSFGQAFAIVAAHHGIWHLYRDDELKHIIWFGTGAIIAGQTINVKANIELDEQLANARAKVTR